MKKYFLLITLLIGTTIFAQKSTYIFIRHAEKDTTAQGSTTMQANPALSKVGQERANRLVKALKEYSIDEIYSTNFIRTQSTVKPIAKFSKKEIQLYDYKKLKEFSEKLLQETNKTILVVGHNNTTPAMVNLLIKENKFKTLDETVFNQIFIVTIENKNATVKEVEY